MSDEITEQPESGFRPHSKRLGRELAMQFLFSCELRGELPGAELFDQFFETASGAFNLHDGRLARRGREYATQLYQTTALHSDEIDGLLAKFCQNWDLSRLSAVDHNIMRVAIAEMLYMDDVPLVVSIDEAVGIARDYSGSDAGNFINGVLNAVKNHLAAKGGKR